MDSSQFIRHIVDQFLQQYEIYPFVSILSVFSIVECIWCKFSCGKLKTPSLTQINFCDPEIYPFVSILDFLFGLQNIVNSKNSVHDGIKPFIGKKCDKIFVKIHKNK
ncbi:hypothetical protein T06_13927 [Trichinella sp. T6]|nr:hypothetical protein T06_13927 [Trichinella sp. T6]